MKKQTSKWHWPYPAGIYLLKVNYKNTRIRCEICSKLTIKTPVIVNFEHVTPCSSVSTVNFEQVNAGWVGVTNQIKYISFAGRC